MSDLNVMPAETLQREIATLRAQAACVAAPDSLLQAQQYHAYLRRLGSLLDEEYRRSHSISRNRGATNPRACRDTSGWRRAQSRAMRAWERESAARLQHLLAAA